MDPEHTSIAGCLFFSRAEKNQKGNGASYVLFVGRKEPKGPEVRRKALRRGRPRCSRKVILVSSSEGAERSRREVLVSLQPPGGRVQRKWRMNRRRWRSMGPSSSISKPGRRPRDGSIRDWKANKRAVKGVICAKRGKNLQLFIPTDISKAEMLRTPSRQNDTRSIKN